LNDGRAAVAVTDNKRKKRLLRYMRFLAGSKATLHRTASPATMLLEFPGERSVRCASADLDAMRRDGLVTVEDEGEVRKVVLAAQGRAALRRGSDDDYAGQHRLLRRTDIAWQGRTEHVTVNDAESPLAALVRMRRSDGLPWLCKEEIAAGERLRADFERAMLQPRVTASWDFTRIATAQKGARNGSADLSDNAIFARGRVNAAIEAVGPELGGALVDVCCFLKGLEQVERERGWPRRSAKLMLKTALAMLDRHYNPEPVRGRRSRQILHWGSDGFRPSLG
jgi:hypothetical protein